MANKMQRDLTPEELKNLMNDILQEATRQGATSADLDIATHKGFTVTVRKGEVESIEYHQDKSVGITVFFGKKTGSVGLSDIRPEAIRSAVQAACNIAKFTDEDPCAGLAEKELLAFDYPKLDLGAEWNVTVDEAIEIARDCEAIALADKRITNSEGANVSTSDGLHVYGNTLGFVGVHPIKRHEISCVLLAKKGDDMQRDHGFTVASDPALLYPVEKVAKEAVTSTVRRLGARRLTTRRAPVIFAAQTADSLLGHLMSAISGGHLYRKTSFLLDHLGKKIFPSHVTIDERPHLPKGLGSTPFDDAGVATRANVFVKDGILTSYVLGIYAARKLQMKTTGNSGGVHNLFINAGKKDLTELLKTMDKGLLVTELMGHGVNIVTGDYSRGAFGFWVENGEIQYPVEEVTIAGHLSDMFANLVEVGSDVDPRGNILTGSILLENMTIAGG